MAGPLSSVIASSELSLADINTIVAQQESLLGPLVALGNVGEGTLLTFDFDSDPPERHAVVAINPPPLNATVLAEGKIFISGQLADVLAYRPN